MGLGGHKKGWINFFDPLTLIPVDLEEGGSLWSGAKAKPGEEGQTAAAAAAAPDTGKVQDVGGLEEQAAQRRLARMSKYFTSPTGVLDSTTGSSGVF